MNTTFTFQKIRNTTFPRLTINTYNFTIPSTNILWINGEIWNIPNHTITTYYFSVSFSKTFTNRILMRTGKGSEHQLTTVWLTLWHDHPGTTFVNLAKRINIGKIQLGINPLRKEV